MAGEQHFEEAASEGLDGALFGGEGTALASSASKRTVT